MGAVGLLGPKGEVGIKGDQGPKGEMGVAVSDVSLGKHLSRVRVVKGATKAIRVSTEKKAIADSQEEPVFPA